MINTMRAAVAALVLGGAGLWGAPLAAQSRLVERGPTTADFAYEQIVRSRITGRDYRIRVWAPIGAEARSSRETPALFVLDGQADVGLAAALARQREARQGAGRWVVTVSPATDEILQPFMRPPGWDGDDHAGFSAFLIDELLPALTQRHGFSYTTLVGEGFAGRAALEVLARDPEAFGVVLVKDPAIAPQRVRELAAAIPDHAQESYAPKLVMTWTSAPHRVETPLLILPQTMAAGGRRTEWHINVPREALIEMALSQ